MSEKSIFSEKEDCKQAWNETKADFSVKVGENDKLQIAGKPVMERWETPYMHLLARSASCQGGRVLELGFGLAIAASEIERSGVKEHWIVECNSEVFQTLITWSKDQPSTVVPLHGLAEDICQILPGEYFDGILYDTYPLSYDEWHSHHLNFIETHVMRLLKPGGVLSFCNLTSWGELMKVDGQDKREDKFTDIEEMFRKTQIPKLLDCGFQEKNISWELLDIVPPDDCDYYSHTRMLAPKCFKNDKN